MRLWIRSMSASFTGASRSRRDVEIGRGVVEEVGGEDRQAQVRERLGELRIVPALAGGGLPGRVADAAGVRGSLPHDPGQRVELVLANVLAGQQGRNLVRLPPRPQRQLRD